jgi:hypothetical protein
MRSLGISKKFQQCSEWKCKILEMRRKLEMKLKTTEE